MQHHVYIIGAVLLYQAGMVHCCVRERERGIRLVCGCVQLPEKEKQSPRFLEVGEVISHLCVTTLEKNDDS